MSQDIDSWLIAVAALCENKVPDKMWENPLPDNAENFEDQYYQSFKTFVEYSTSLSTDLVVEVNILKYNPYFEERAKSILRNINKLSFSNTSELWLLSYALSKNPTLLSRIEINENNYVIIIWCLAQCVDSDINYVLSFFHEKLFDKPPVSNQVNCHAFLLLLHFLLTKLDISDDDQPPFSTDEFEVIFCLAFCSKRSQAKALAASIVPLMANFISQTNASHLLFRRMLPYCAMVNRDGQKMALAIIESIVSNYERFLSCMSTWISLHRMYFLAASVTNHLYATFHSKQNKKKKIFFELFSKS